MEGKMPAASIVDELFGPKDTKQPSSSGYFSTVFPPPSVVLGKDSSRRAADGKAHVSASKNHGTGSKDGKAAYPTDSTESPYFGSSVHYGGRDFYGSSQSKHATETSNSYKSDDNDGSAATRGDWWQGSLYY